MTHPVPAPARPGVTLTFDREKVTPGTVRFKERTVPGQLPVIGQIYVKKTALASLGDPTTLTVTLEGACE